MVTTCKKIGKPTFCALLSNPKPSGWKLLLELTLKKVHQIEGGKKLNYVKTKHQNIIIVMSIHWMKLDFD